MDKNIFDYEDAIERVGDEELLYELLDDFLEFAEEILLEIDQAVKEKNSDVIRNSGHTLKGTAANLSLTNLSNVGLELETAGKTEQTEKYKPLYNKLVKCVDEYKKFMREK